MALYSVRPCEKDGTNVWRLIGMVGKKVELRCVRCGASVYIPEDK